MTTSVPEAVAPPGTRRLRPSETLDPGHIRSVFGVDPALVRMPVLSA